MCAVSVRRSLHLQGCALGVGVLLIALTATSASGGLLLTDPNTLQSGAVNDIVGSMDLDEDGVLDLYMFTADLEYAVYQESAPALSLSFPNLYIYAYQFFNHDESQDVLNAFSMGIAENQLVGNVGYVADPDPDYTSIAPSSGVWNQGASSVKWQFSTLEVAPNEQSEILYFTSPFGPGRAYATLAGGMGVTVDDPGSQPFSPIPEPSTAWLMSIGAVALLLANFIRQVYGRTRLAVQ
jgi:hypothetical protein